QEVTAACAGLEGVSVEAVMAEVRRNLYDGILQHEVGLAQTMAARALVEQEPNYTFVSARFLLNSLRDEAFGFVFRKGIPASQGSGEVHYGEYFPEFVRR